MPRVDALEKDGNSGLDYTLAEGADWVWIRVNGIAIYISRVHTKLIEVEMYRTGYEAGSVIDSCQVRED